MSLVGLEWGMIVFTVILTTLSIGFLVCTLLVGLPTSFEPPSI